MNDLHSNESRAVLMVGQHFLVDSNTHHESYEALALTQAEFDDVRTPNATGWRHFLRLQGLGAAPSDFDVRSAANMLAQLKWTPGELIQLLEATRAEVSEPPVLLLPALHRRLFSRISQGKKAL